MAKITHWDTEDKQFWESTGKAIANRNLWVSIPNLLCGFAGEFFLDTEDNA